MFEMGPVLSVVLDHRMLITGYASQPAEDVGT